ncbi:MAG: ABC transporter ATP-binding protein [Sulfurifustis sp.]
MIVYHLCRASDVPQYLAHGLVRADGRHYVFDRWQDAQLLLNALHREADVADDPYIALVIECDEDMLAAAPMPDRKAPAGLRPEDLARLQARSAYAEVDVSSRRIVDVKNGFGDSVLARYQPRPKGRAPIWRFLAYARPYYPYVVAATAAGLVKFLAPLAFPWVLKEMLDQVVLNSTLGPTAKQDEVLSLVFAVLAVNVVWMIATYYRSVFAAVAGHRMMRDIRVALFNHVQRLSHAFFARHQTGAIVSRVVNDISLAQNFVGSALTNVWMDLALLLALIAILVSIHPWLTLVSLVLMPVYLFALKAMGPRIQQTSKEVQQRLEVLSGELHEKVAGVAIVKGFARETAEGRAFAEHANKLLKKVLYSVRFSATNEVAVGFVVHTAPVLVAGYGVYQIIGGQLTVGELTQFLLYLGMFYQPLQRLSDLSVVLSNALAAIDRIFEYFDTQPHVTERSRAVTLTECRGRIDFEHVQFSYDGDTPILQDIQLSVAPGQTVAFVGPSGAGKSTLANLVPRFYDPTDGRILLDGHDLRDIELTSLRLHIGIVNQETILFSGTVQENLLLAKPNASSEEIVAALEAANAWEFVQRLPEGLGTEIGERGAVLSGGQKQRLAIARAFLKDPRILILDEATSSLDSRSERRIQDALHRLLRNRTSIVIAHRLSTVLRADLIVVLDGGCVVDTGRHAELLARGGLYAQLYNEQFGHSDLAKAG